MFRTLGTCALDTGLLSSFSQASTLSWLASTHFFAASSGDMPSCPMYIDTRFWSALVHLKFLTRSTAGEPESANFVAISLFRWYGG